MENGTATSEPNTLPQGQDLGEDPPMTPPVFPVPTTTTFEQQGQPQGPFSLLTPPPPGGLTKSPEELTRQIGWTALTEAVTNSAVTLYPNDPQAVALTIANTLQPYMTAFTPQGRNVFPTVGTTTPTQNTSMSKTTEGIVLGALTGTK